MNLERFNTWYPTFLRALHGIGEVLMTVTQTVLVSIGIPIILGLLLYVEQQRVMHGIEMFEASHTLAMLAAWALVLTNLTLEFQIHYVETKAGWHEDQQRKFSLRVWWRDASYWLGLGNWKERLHSPARDYRRLLRLVSFSIVALALLGSMKTVMQDTPGAWHTAIVDVVMQSDLVNMSIWVGGLLLTLTAVLAAQRLCRTVAIRAAEAVARMEAVIDQETPNHSHAKQKTPLPTLNPVPARAEKQGYKAVCDLCGWEGNRLYDTERNAARALAAHRKTCPVLHPELAQKPVNGTQS